MKNIWKLGASAAAIVMAGIIYAQESYSLSALIEEPPLPPQLNLPLVAPEYVPESGTFWLYSHSAESSENLLPPFPYDPYGGVMPVHQLPDMPGQFVIADTKEDYDALQALNRSLKYGWGDGMMSSMSSGLPEFPGDDEEPGEGGDTNQYFGMIYGTNDLWLEISNLVNEAADFVIHPPTEEEPAAYDLFSTTNLALDVPGLNATNWVWLVRTDVGQTNVTLTSIWPEIGFSGLARCSTRIRMG